MPARAAPRLKSRLAKADGSVKTVAAVDEVVLSGEGERDMGIVGEAEGSLRRMLEETCGAETVVVDGTAGDLPSPKTYPRRPTVIEVDFEAPSATDRFEQLYLNDAVIASLIELLPSSNYTVVYATTPVDSSIPFPLDSEPAGRQASSDKDQDFTAARYKFNQYDQEVYQDPEGLLNLQVKRDTNAHQKEDGEKTNDIPGGVFERYQFLSPGIFMGLFASLLFVIIISVGITAITSLEISYGSFVKDNSPQAAKKAQ
ncbi:hypothetical protein KEM56_000913 [Ascosphaera pollenicola]|nr:hypothetical protein KEM56_000913 [Ascosphaera pollenicola]